MASTNQRMSDLVRMLNLLPYFQSHPGCSVMEAAADLGLPPAQVKDDLYRLFCCGPGVFPHELVDLDPNVRSVTIFDSQGMDQPLRLTVTEATALLLALEYLEAVPGLADRGTVVSAATKLRESMGSAIGAVFDTDSFGRDFISEPELEILTRAMTSGRQVEFEYTSRTTEGMHTRRVSIQRMFTRDTNAYIQGYDHDREEVRMFRLDRMTGARETGEPAVSVPLAPLDTRDPFDLKKADTQAVLVFDEESAWLADTLPVTEGFWNDDDKFEVHVPLIAREWLIQFALENADRVRVIEPSDVSHEIANRAKSALRAYDGRIVT